MTDLFCRETCSYVCATCEAIVVSGEAHEHHCPLEDLSDEMCGLQRCNETGKCQR